jgi:hypothetical protein
MHGRCSFSSHPVLLLHTVIQHYGELCLMSTRLQQATTVNCSNRLVSLPWCIGKRWETAISYRFDTIAVDSPLAAAAVGAPCRCRLPC